jgi:hypothetical protein
MNAFYYIDELASGIMVRRVRIIQEMMVLCKRMYDDFDLQKQEPYKPNLYDSIDTPAGLIGVQIRTRQGRLHLWSVSQQESVLTMWLQQEKTRNNESLVKRGALPKEKITSFFTDSGSRKHDSLNQTDMEVLLKTQKIPIKQASEFVKNVHALQS